MEDIFVELMEFLNDGDHNLEVVDVAAYAPADDHRGNHPDRVALVLLKRKPAEQPWNH